MNFRLIRALVAKDFALHFRNRMYAILTVVTAVFFIIIYFVMPDAVDEELKIGLYAPVLPPVFEMIPLEEGLVLEPLDSEEALVAAVNGRDYVAGIALPADIMEKFAAGFINSLISMSTKIIALCL